MENENEKRVKKKRSRGRPKKTPRVRPKSGRKQIFDMTNAGKNTRYEMANKIIKLVHNNEEFLEFTLELCKKKNRKTTDKNDQEEPMEEADYDDNEVKFTHSNESSLALYIESNLNTKSYKFIASDCRLRGFKYLPSHLFLQKAIAECMPENISYSESEVIVPLQSILNKTAERLCEAVAKDWSSEELLDVQLYVTSGVDSSSGHLNPHQNYDNTNNVNSNARQSLLVTSLLVQKLTGSNKCSWINPTPQSTRFCRPLRISFEKEDDAAIIREYNRLSQEIRFLNRYRFKNSNGKLVIVKFIVSETLYDGKCVNCILGNTASTRCPICHVSSHKFGDLTLNFEPQENSLRLGLGLLHCLIKAFEYLLHLSYRKTIENWDRRQHLLEKADEQTKKVRKQLNEAFGIRVDQVLQGHGTTNTGNLARLCFSDPIKFAKALEIDEELVSKISLILSLLRCKEELDIAKFETLCKDTYQLNYTRYPWSRMCPTLHKLLKHGTAIIQNFPMPIVYYSEDASESSHKIYRENLICHSRQTSRKDRIVDTFNRAMYTSDPLISLIYINNRLKGQQQHPITQEMSTYLKIREQMEYKNYSSGEEDQDISDDQL